MKTVLLLNQDYASRFLCWRELTILGTSSSEHPVFAVFFDGSRKPTIPIFLGVLLQIHLSKAISIIFACLIVCTFVYLFLKSMTMILPKLFGYQKWFKPFFGSQERDTPFGHCSHLRWMTPFFFFAVFDGLNKSKKESKALLAVFEQTKQRRIIFRAPLPEKWKGCYKIWERFGFKQQASLSVSLFTDAFSKSMLATGWREGVIITSAMKTTQLNKYNI